MDFGIQKRLCNEAIPLLQESAGFSADATTLILLAYGVFSFIGNLIVGKFADNHAVGVLRFGHALLFISLGLIALFANVPSLVLVTVLIVGLAGVTMNPALVARVAEVGGTGNLVSTVHTSVITSGVALGAAISASTISTFGGNPSIAMWTGVGFAILAALTLATETRSRKPPPSTEVAA